MSQHRILRQVIELDACPPGTDAALRAQLGALVQRHLMPVIERACDALDAPGRLLRAERLTLDLGDLPLAADSLRPADEDWGRQLAERLEACLQPALAEALQPADARQAGLELLAQFIASGSVPWWADLADRALLATAVWRVLDDGPALRSLGLDEVGAAWPRLLASAGEAEAMRWLDALLPDAGARALWRPWREALADAAVAAGGAAQALRPLWWALALPAAARGRIDGHGPDPGALAQALVAALGLPPARLWPAWRRAFDRRLSSAGSGAGAGSGPAPGQAPGQAGHTAAAAWWRALDQAPSAGADHGTAPAPAGAGAAFGWLQRQAAAQDAGSLVQRLLAALLAAWPHLPAHARDAAAARLAALTQAAGADAGMAGTAGVSAPAVAPPTLGTLSAQGWQALAALLQATDQAGRLPSALADALRAAALAPQALPAVAALGKALAMPGRASAADPAAIDRRFSDSEQITVADAGLVLLWPFLPAFFARLGWLTTEAGAGRPPGRAFGSALLAARAVVLLHRLATGDEAAPDAPVAEHLLPLPKLLCGLAPEAPLIAAPADAAADPASDQAAWRAALAEGDLLLQAVIAQAPILRAMSVPAFRASFLLRAGQLGVRDDHWLLRVERTAYDLVRDRFPWAVSVLRLPWMNSTLQVEW